MCYRPGPAAGGARPEVSLDGDAAVATITVLFGPDNLGAHKMTHSPFTVGRDPTCGATIDNAGVSRYHCKFIWDGKHFFVEDMESANGTYHHGHKIRKASIADGDKVQIGKFTLLFKHGKDEAPPSIKEEWSLGPRSEKEAMSDPMLTFKMDGQAMRRQMEEMQTRAPAGPRRAADVARAFRPSAEPSGVRRPRKSLVGRLFKFVVILALLGVLALAAFAALQSLGVIDIDLNW
jgi:predicted component of type VI protein secretion system